MPLSRRAFTAATSPLRAAALSSSAPGSGGASLAINKGHAEIAALLLEKGARNSDQVLLLGVQKAHVKLVRASMANGGLQPYDLTAAFVQATRDGRTEIAAIL